MPDEASALTFTRRDGSSAAPAGGRVLKLPRPELRRVDRRLDYASCSAIEYVLRGRVMQHLTAVGCRPAVLRAGCGAWRSAGGRARDRADHPEGPVLELTVLAVRWG